MTKTEITLLSNLMHRVLSAPNAMYAHTREFNRGKLHELCLDGWIYLTDVELALVQQMIEDAEDEESHG